MILLSIIILINFSQVYIYINHEAQYLIPLYRLFAISYVAFGIANIFH